MSNAKSFDFLLKICVLADRKPLEFLRPNLNDSYPIYISHLVRRYLPTIGMEFSVEDVKFLDKRLKVQYWNTSSDTRFDYVRPLYYKNSHGIIFIVDLDKKNAYNFLKGQYQLIDEGCYNYPIYIVGLETGSTREKSSVIKFILNKLYQIRFSAFLKKNRKKHPKSEFVYFEFLQSDQENLQNLFKNLLKEMLKKIIEEENKLV